MAEARLHLVVDPDDTPENAQLLANLHAPLAGRLVCEAQPDERRQYQLAWDILAALGKNPRLAGQVRSLGLVWPSLIAWLVGTPTEQLFVSRAHLLDAGAWRVLIKLAAHTDLELWLLVQGTELGRGQREVMTEWPLAEHTLGAFRSRWARTANRRNSEGEPVAEPFPDVPDEDFALFRAAARELLAPRAFDRVDRVFTRTLADARRWCPGRSLDEETAAGYLQRQLADCSELPEIVTRLRALQVAFFHERLLVRADVPRLAAREELTRPATLDGAALARLRRYVLPRYPAAALLSCVSRATPAELAALTVGAIEMDGSTTTIDGDQFAIGDGADILRSCRYYRIAEGASEAEPLFIKLESPGRRKTPEAAGIPALHQMLQRVAREVGLPLLNRWNPRKPRTARDDVRLAGIRIERF